MSLIKHLDQFGIKHFDNESYWAWGGQMLSQVMSEGEFHFFEKLRRPMMNNPKPAQRLAFYEFIAKRGVAAVVHSTKADAICKSGEAIERKIGASRKILDIGCNSGYLTSWYANQHPASAVIGVDISYESVNTANRFFKELNLTNVQARHGSPEVIFRNEKFDCIVDSQSVYEAFNRRNILNWIEKSLDESGVFITVPQATNAENFDRYTRELESCNLEIIDFEALIFNDLGEVSAYPLLVTKKSKNLKAFNSSEAFQALIEQLTAARLERAPIPE